MSQVADDDPGCEFAVANGGPKVETGPDQPRIPVTDKDGNLVLDDEGVPEYAGPFGVPGVPTDGGAAAGARRPREPQEVRRVGRARRRRAPDPA